MLLNLPIGAELRKAFKKVEFQIYLRKFFEYIRVFENKKANIRINLKAQT